MNEHLGRRIPRVIRWLGILGVLSVTATAGAARAQVTTGTILGTVTDETGAALPGALPASTVFNSSGLAEDAGEIIRTVGTSRQIQLGIKLEF